MRTLGASRWQAFRFAEWPAALPAALSGARIAVAVAVIGAVIAEISTAGPPSGLGHEIQLDLDYVTAQTTPRAWAATAVLFCFALACFYAFGCRAAAARAVERGGARAARAMRTRAVGPRSRARSRCRRSRWRRAASSRRRSSRARTSKSFTVDARPPAERARRRRCTPRSSDGAFARGGLAGEPAAPPSPERAARGCSAEGEGGHGDLLASPNCCSRATTGWRWSRSPRSSRQPLSSVIALPRRRRRKRRRARGQARRARRHRIQADLLRAVLAHAGVPGGSVKRRARSASATCPRCSAGSVARDLRWLLELRRARARCGRTATRSSIPVQPGGRAELRRARARRARARGRARRRRPARVPAGAHARPAGSQGDPAAAARRS